MEEYRKKVEWRMRIYTGLCLCSLAIYLALKFVTKGASDFAQGLTIGVFVGMECVAVYNFVKALAALKNEEKLKEMYITENDERNINIQKETSRTGSAISIFCTAIAAIAAGFFDEKICITIVAVLVFSGLIHVIISAYYNKKM